MCVCNCTVTALLLLRNCCQYMPQSVLIGSTWLTAFDHNWDAVIGRSASTWVRVRVIGDVNKRRKDQLSAVLLLYDKQLFSGGRIITGDRWNRHAAVVRDVVKPALTVDCLVATGLARIHHRRSSSHDCFRRRCYPRMSGTHVSLEPNGLYRCVAAESTMVRLLSGVAHAMTSHGIVIACWISADFTPLTAQPCTCQHTKQLILRKL